MAFGLRQLPGSMAFGWRELLGPKYSLWKEIITRSYGFWPLDKTVTCMWTPFRGKSLSCVCRSGTNCRNSFLPLYSLMAYRSSPCRWKEQFRVTDWPRGQAGGNDNTRSLKQAMSEMENYFLVTVTFENITRIVVDTKKNFTLKLNWRLCWQGVAC